MKTANEMNAIANKVKAEHLAKEKTQAINYVEKVLAPRIEEAANRGHNRANFSKEHGLRWIYIKTYLEENGYTVESATHAFTVSW